MIELGGLIYMTGRGMEIGCISGMEVLDNR